MGTTLLISSFTNSNRAVSAQDGDKVYNAILPYFEKNESVTLDFEGIELIITAFLNTCIGKLYGKFSSDELKTLLDIQNLKKDEMRLLKLVIDKAKERFNKQPPDKEQAD